MSKYKVCGACHLSDINKTLDQWVVLLGQFCHFRLLELLYSSRVELGAVAQCTTHCLTVFVHNDSVATGESLAIRIYDELEEPGSGLSAEN